MATFKKKRVLFVSLKCSKCKDVDYSWELPYFMRQLGKEYKKDGVKCPACKKRGSERIKELRKERKAQGLCVKCGTPHKGVLLHCDACCGSWRKRQDAKEVTDGAT